MNISDIDSFDKLKRDGAVKELMSLPADVAIEALHSYVKARARTIRRCFLGVWAVFGAQFCFAASRNFDLVPSSKGLTTEFYLIWFFGLPYVMIIMIVVYMTLHNPHNSMHILLSYVDKSHLGDVLDFFSLWACLPKDIHIEYRTWILSLLDELTTSGNSGELQRHEASLCRVLTNYAFYADEAVLNALLNALFPVKVGHHLSA